MILTCLLGFSSSLFFCQRAEESLAGSSTATMATVKMSDRGPTAVIDLANNSSLQVSRVYVDNICWRQAASWSPTASCDIFKARGLLVLEDVSRQRR